MIVAASLVAARQAGVGITSRRRPAGADF